MTATDAHSRHARLVQSDNGKTPPPLHIIPEVPEEDDSRQSVYSLMSLSPYAACESPISPPSQRSQSQKRRRDGFYFMMSSPPGSDAASPCEHKSPHPPPSRPLPSPTPSFLVNLSDLNLDFPHPPLLQNFESLRPPTASTPTFGDRSRSPTPSLCSTSSGSSSSAKCPPSPCKDVAPASSPTTPSSCDVPLPSERPRRVTIRPLVIVKTGTRSESGEEETIEIDNTSCSDETISPKDSLLSSPEMDIKSGQVSEWRDTVIIHCPSDEEREEDSEDKVRAWYAGELGKFITLSSSLPPSLNLPAKRDSISVLFPPPSSLPAHPPSSFNYPPPRSQRRTSPRTSLSPVQPHNTRIPAPPSPPLRSSRSRRARYSSRPAPRESVPRDVDLDLDSRSVMSGGFEWDYARGTTEPVRAESGGGERESVLLEIALDQFPNLSLTLPTSPLNLEMFIGTHWDELARTRENASSARPESPMGTMYGTFFDDMEDDEDDDEGARSQPLSPSNPPQQQKQQKLQKQQRRLSRRQPTTTTPALRSKWSSSTLASGVDEEERGENKRDRESASPSRGFRFPFGRQKKAKPSPVMSPPGGKRVPLPSPVDLPSVILHRSSSMKSVENSGKSEGFLSRAGSGRKKGLRRES